LKKPEDSPAVALVRHLWDHAQEATGHSWTRLNGALYQAVALAVRAGLEFAPGDVRALYDEFNGGFWFHEQNGEGWYAEAVEYRNASAWKSLEGYWGRWPFLWEGERMHVGRQFRWQGEHVTCTSFNDKEGYFVACSYEHKGEGRDYARSVKRRHKVTHADLAAARKAAKAPPRPAPVPQEA
jgi:hypothetical protein